MSFPLCVRTASTGSFRRKFGAILLQCGLVGAFFNLFSCATLPAPTFNAYAFPEQDVFVETKPTRRYKVVGPVRVRVNYNSLNADREELELCRNYYNKGVADLLKRARRDLKADAIVEVQSVVYYLDGKSKSFPTPECSDDGGEGQILLQAKAIRYLPPRKKRPI